MLTRSSSLNHKVVPRHIIHFLFDLFRFFCACDVLRIEMIVLENVINARVFTLNG
jgi:hypothetical protein